ncbi:hypothetical protein [Chondromyces crocatus]|uniref:Beta-ketoacyl synthase N-terminal domain-containing protein n=1 Tax=Chondromyces crocatus TaxID=52 RepID=A0A0K1EIC5_CHOCO|nr:hypothetical protein [Chondromyces crocatus]AKT40605.1 uncharacterized protein CMC5_047610 [Chondromyces crocatus]
MSTTGVIVGVGMSTPLGLDARQSSLVLRARKLTPGKTAFHDGRGRAVGNVRARRLDDGCVGRARLIELAAPALAEATRGRIDRRTPVPLFLALPQRSTASEEPLGPDFVEAIAKRAQVNVALEHSEPFPLGRAGFAAALARGLAALSSPSSGLGSVAVVGGVDSHHDPGRLAALDAERRLHAEEVWDGFIPSEAAAFVVISLPGPSPAMARVTAVATGMEREEEDPGEPPCGETATEVVRTAAQSLRAPVPWVLPDVNGERHRIKEWSFVRIRNREHLDESVTLETRLYDELGDVGAASGAVHAAYVSMAFRLGFAPARQALITLASDGRTRGAFALEAP